MTCTPGTNEPAIRFDLGVSLFVAAGFLTLPGWATGVMYVVGGVAFLSSFFAFCPVWKLFRINTCQ